MRQKILVSSVLVVALLVAMYSGSSAKAETYEIDPVHSSVVFQAGHLGISKLFGRINDFGGSIVIDEANLDASSVRLEIDPASVDTNSADRDKHLRGPDFFNVKQFPAWRFASTGVKKNSDGTFRVTGEMQLHGVKKTMSVNFEKVGEGEDPWGGYRQGWYSEFSLKRSDFGIDYMAEGLADEIQVYIAIEGIRK